VRKGAQDAFGLERSSDGSTLLHSTLLGGSGTGTGVGGDTAFSGIYVYSDGSVYVAGSTDSPDFPVTPGAFQTTYKGASGRALGAGGDGFVARLKPDLSGLIFSTYLGGSDNDEVCANDCLVVDSAGNAYVIGETTSFDFPVTANAFRKTHTSGGTGWDAMDAFVAKISPTGQLLASTYIGSSGRLEEASGIDVDAAGNVYFSGNTAGTDFPVTPNAYQSTLKGNAGTPDAWFAKMSPDLSTLLYSTYFGSSGGDRGRALVLFQGNVIISGDAGGQDFPLTSGAYQTTLRGSDDGFVARFFPK
jgi:hypothetical protein